MLSRLLSRQACRALVCRRSIQSYSKTLITTTSPPPVGRRLLQISQTSRSYATTPMAAPTDTAATEVQNSTGITPETLTESLRTSSTLSASHVDIQDISGGCGQSFAALIVSDAFQGKSALQRHRLVNGILKEEIKAIHAWTPRCLTEEQWQKEQQRTQ